MYLFIKMKVYLLPQHEPDKNCIYFALKAPPHCIKVFMRNPEFIPLADPMINVIALTMANLKLALGYQPTNKIPEIVAFYSSYRHVLLILSFSHRLSAQGLFQSQVFPQSYTCPYGHSVSANDEPACSYSHRHLIFHFDLFQIQ